MVRQEAWASHFATDWRAGGAVDGADPTMISDSWDGSICLRNAIEIMAPDQPGHSAVGNHNGQCESNESCMDAPNFGVYLGHGLVGPCNFHEDAIAGVTMLGFASNGRWLPTRGPSTPTGRSSVSTGGEVAPEADLRLRRRFLLSGHEALVLTGDAA